MLDDGNTMVFHWEREEDRDRVSWRPNPGLEEEIFSPGATKLRGELGERLVMGLLAEQGYEIMGKNLADRTGEIDLWAFRGVESYPVEVRFRVIRPGESLEPERIGSPLKKGRCLRTMRHLAYKTGNDPSGYWFVLLACCPGERTIDVYWYDWMTGESVSPGHKKKGGVAVAWLPLLV